jgi:ribosomal protein S18 acetylase RimI-like enzyme
MSNAPVSQRAAVSVRRAGPGDLPALVRMLARAFDADPFYNWILPQDARRAQSFIGIFELILGRMSDDLSETFATTALDGCAIWKRPGNYKMSMLRQAQLLPSFARILGWRSIPRGMRLLEHMDRLHARFAPEPHLYLYVLGVDPAQQRRGLGAQLLQPGFERADRERHRVYLETACADNVPFYERQGFQLQHTAEHAEFPTLWAMTRDPR